jgi:ADP-ribose pyrophosphatase YjhB (NUDIX family)
MPPEALISPLTGKPLPLLPPPHTRLGVGGVLIRDGRVLVNKAFYRPQYTLPSGYVDPGEAVEAALTREFEEETGLRVQVGPLLMTRHKVVSRGESDLYLAFAVEWRAGTPSARPPEIEAFREVPVAEAVDAPWISALSRRAIRVGARGVGGWPRSDLTGGDPSGMLTEAYHVSDG